MSESPVSAIVKPASAFAGWRAAARAGARWPGGGVSAWRPMTPANSAASAARRAERASMRGRALEVKGPPPAQRPRRQDVGDAAKARPRHVGDRRDRVRVRHVQDVEAE